MSYDEAKHNTIIQLFKHGKTLREIGSAYSVTSERIRQVLARHGVSACEGGRSIAIRERSAAHQEKREQVCIEKHGCTLDQFRAACAPQSGRSQSAHLAFVRQRNHANSRGIVWNLKFWAWYCIWQESGKWASRGRGTAGYCMCRIGDAGAYAPGNIYIGSVVHNSTLGRTLAHERSAAPDGFRLVMHVAGGRKVVSEALGVSRAYLSQLANDGYMPRCWLSDGRATALASLTRGAYSPDDLAELFTRPSEKEAA